MASSQATFQVRPAAHERSWRLQRISWAAGAAVLVAAATGRLGGSSASRAESASPEGDFLIRHDRYCRSGLPADFELYTPGAGPELPVTIAGDFFEHFQIREITPRPVRERAGPGGVTLIFDDSGGGPIRLRCQTRGPGPARAAFTAGGRAVTLDQFIYP